MRKNNRKAVHPRLKVAFQNRMDELRDFFFHVQRLEMASYKGNRKVVEHRSVVMCTSIQGLIQYIKARRNADESILKIGIDGGQGSLKIVLNIEERDRQTKKGLKDSGVRQALILALAPGIQENYENISKIWYRMGLHSINSSFAGMLGLHTK